MTSFDPEADEAAPQEGATPRERERQGNGSAGTVPAGTQPAAGAGVQGRTDGDAGGQAAGDADGTDGSGAVEVPQAAEDGAAEGTQPAEEVDALEAARREAAVNLDRFMRLQAEFENYKKRTHKEHADSLRYALSPLVAEFAAIMDNLERAAEHARKEQGEAVEALLAGIEMVVKQMQEVLGRFGVRRIEAVGKPFDPSLHEAINVVETDDCPENQVLEEYQAGYLLHDRVVRPSRVCVSKRSAVPKADAADGE